MAAIRMLFSWLTEKGVLAMNPAREVKTERFSRTEGKTPAFIDGEVHKLLDAVVFHTSVGNPKAGNRRPPEFPGSSQETVSRLPSCYGEPIRCGAVWSSVGDSVAVPVLGAPHAFI